MKSNSGFSLIEVMLSLALLFGLTAAVGYGLATQKKQEVALSDKLALTNLLEVVALKLNSFDVARTNFNSFSGAMGSADQTAFAKCYQNQVAANSCLMFMNPVTYPPVTSTETTPVGLFIQLQVVWTSSIQCTASSCSTFNTIAVPTLLPANSSIASSNEFLAMQGQVAKMLASSQRNFPILSFVTKQDKGYACASNPANGPVIGLNPGNVEAICGGMTGGNTCGNVGSTPLIAFGGVIDNCEPLVNIGCGQGLGAGGFFDGSCKPPGGGQITSSITTDGNGASNVLVCGPGGDCISFTRSLASSVDIITQLQNSGDYNQLMTTWKNEGLLAPSALGVDLQGNAMTWNTIYGNGLSGATGVVVTYIPGGTASPIGSTVSNGAVAAPGNTVDPNLF